MGCNYMRCSPPGGCGKSFCYVCEEPWEDDSDGTHHRSYHMNCSKFKDKNLNSEKEKNVLARYNFYFEKFLGCDSAKRKA